MFFEGWERCLTGTVPGDCPEALQRMTEEQLQYYARDPGYRVRSLAAAGTELRVRTDAHSLEMEARVEEGSSQDLWGFDLLLDGRLYAHLDGRTSRQSEIVWQVVLPEGEKCLTLCFPCLARVILRKLTLPGATLALPDCPKRRLLCCGDSISQGYTTRFPSLAWPSAAARDLNMELLNQSVAGMTFEAETPILPTGAEVVLIAYGTNDWICKDAARLERDARAVIDHAKQAHPRARVAVLTPIWRADENEAQTLFPFERLRSILESCALDADALVLPGDRLLPRVRELLRDKVHPNEMGHAIYGARAAQAISASALI